MSDFKKKELWNERYLSDHTPWDINQACPEFINYFKDISKSKKIAVLGCGKGHDAFHLAEAGFDVSGFDFAENAIAFCNQKKAKLNLENISFYEKDFFQLETEFKSSFDIVLEHTSFCAIPPARRGEYLNVIKYLLKPKGHLVGMFYINSEISEKPPHGITLIELKSLYKEAFNEVISPRKGKCVHGSISLEEREYFSVLEAK